MGSTRVLRGGSWVQPRLVLPVGQEPLECLQADELPRAVAAAIGHPLGEEPQFHGRELAVGASVNPACPKMAVVESLIVNAN